MFCSPFSNIIATSLSQPTHTLFMMRSYSPVCDVVAAGVSRRKNFGLMDLVALFLAAVCVLSRTEWLIFLLGSWQKMIWNFSSLLLMIWKVRFGFRGCSSVIGPLWHLNNQLVILVIIITIVVDVVVMSITIIKPLSAQKTPLSWTHRILLSPFHHIFILIN